MKCFRKKTSSETKYFRKEIPSESLMEQTVEAVKNNLPGTPALKLNFGSKFYKPLQVWGFIRKQSLHKAFLLFREQWIFKGNFSFLR